MENNEVFKRYEHTPAHLYRNKTPYFITGAIYKNRRLLTPDLKKLLIEVFHGYMKKFEWQLQHWVVLDNHYHLLCLSERGKDLPQIMQQLHSYTSREILRCISCEKPVWYNYWDYCPRDEHDYYTRLNYLLYNPVRHGYVTDLKEYEFSSFSTLFQEIGRKKLLQQFDEYPGYKDMRFVEGFDDD